MRWLALVFAAAFLAASACSSKPATSKKSIETDSQTLDAQIAVHVKGAEPFDFEGRTKIIIFRTLDTRVPLEFRLFSVGIPEPGVKFGDASFARAAFDVLGFKGANRSYTIPRTILGASPSANGLQVPSGIQSNAFVQFLRLKDTDPLERYDVALEPCRVRSEKDARKGSLTCPSLRRDNGTDTVSLTMTWDAA